MSEVAAEVLTQFVAKQAQVWQGVALHLSEQSNTLVEIPTPTTTAVPIAELTGLTVDTVLHIQAHFGEHPESPCIFVVGEQPGERAAAQKALLEATLGSAPETIDESALQKAQEFGTHLLQGLALAFGNLSGKTFTPGQVVARYEPIVFPPNFLTVDEVIVTRFVVRVPDREPIALSWMLTEDLARALLGMPAASDPFASLSAEPSSAQAPTPTPTAPAFNPFAETEESSERNLELLLDIPLEVSVELGRVTMLVRDLLEIGTGSIVELQKAAGEPVEVLVNGRLIARGEVVVVEDNFAVRITEIIPPTERVQRLGA